MQPRIADLRTEATIQSLLELSRNPEDVDTAENDRSRKSGGSSSGGALEEPGASAGCAG